MGGSPKRSVKITMMSRLISISWSLALECAAIQDVLESAGKLEQSENRERKIMLSRIVAMLTKLSNVSYCVEEENGIYSMGFDSDSRFADSDSEDGKFTEKIGGQFIYFPNPGIRIESEKINDFSILFSSSFYKEQFFQVYLTDYHSEFTSKTFEDAHQGTTMLFHIKLHSPFI